MDEAKHSGLLALLPTVSRETVMDLQKFERLVVKWQSHINLISPTTIATAWQRHILDSVQPFIIKSEANVWLDIGSGGGFPGIVTAILLKQRNGASVSLVESNNKKAAFLRLVIAELRLPAQVYAERIENLYGKLPVPEIITARAFASLNDIFRITKPWLSKKTVALLQKGRDYEQEIEEAYANWTFNLIKHRSMIEDDSFILEIKQLHRIEKGEPI